LYLAENRALLDGYRRGDPEVLALVFEHYYPQVVQLVQEGFSFQSGGSSLRFKGYRHSADLFDVVHEIFRAAFEEKARRGYGGLRPFGGYLHVIGRNLIVSRLRRDSRLVETESEEVLAAIPSSAPNPEDALVRGQERAAVTDFLSGLPAEEREFARLRFEEDLAQEAVAREMGVGRKKVRLLETKLRQKLGSFLRSRGISRGERTSAQAEAQES
jgi:RNA polymerase sigma-70 factor (ECF subfamily)